MLPLLSRFITYLHARWSRFLSRAPDRHAATHDLAVSRIAVGFGDRYLMVCK